MKALLPLLMLAVTSPALAQAPAAPKTANPITTARKFPGVSDAGNAILNKAMSTRDPQLVEAVKAQRAARDALVHFAMTPPIDPDRLATLLKESETAQSQVRLRNYELMVAAIRQLNDADRAAYVRTLAPQAPPAAPAR